MAKVLYDNIVSIQEWWKESPLSGSEDMITLTSKLMHKLIDNGHELDGVSLLYPEDCDNYDVFSNVAYGLNAIITKTDHGLIMTGFGNHCGDIEVE